MPGPFGLLGSFPQFKMMNSTANSYEKELNNKIPKSKRKKKVRNNNFQLRVQD